MSIEQPSMDFHYDRIIDENFSGEIADKLKKEVRNSFVVTQELLLDIEKAQKIIEAHQDDEKYVKEQEFEIKCLVREIKGEPGKGTTDEEKEEYRKFHPTTMSDEQIEKAKEAVSKLNIS